MGSEADADETKHAPPGEQMPPTSKGSAAVGQTMLGVTLHWGNEYARWHTKRLTFQVAVISKLALTRARRRHGELREAKQHRGEVRSVCELGAAGLHRTARLEVDLLLLLCCQVSGRVVSPFSHHDCGPRFLLRYCDKHIP